MNLFTKTLSLFYWFISFCAASGDNTFIKNTELDFLNKDLNIVELSNEKIVEAFCINDEHGKEHKQFVIDFLKTFLEDQEKKILYLCILKKIVDAIQAKNNVSFEFRERIAEAYIIRENCPNETSNSSLSLIYSFILQFGPDTYKQFSLRIDNSLSVKVNPTAKNQMMETVKTPGTTSHKINPVPDDNVEVLYGSPTLGEKSIALKFKYVMKTAIENLKSIMNMSTGFYTDPKDMNLLKLNVRDNQTLNEEEIEKIIAILPKTILSNKFSILTKEK